MNRREFVGVVAAAPVVVACREETRRKADPTADDMFGALRKFAIVEDVEPAMTFVPLRQPR